MAYYAPPPGYGPGYGHYNGHDPRSSPYGRAEVQPHPGPPPDHYDPHNHHPHYDNRMVRPEAHHGGDHRYDRGVGHDPHPPPPQHPGYHYDSRHHEGYSAPPPTDPYGRPYDGSYGQQPYGGYPPPAGGGSYPPEAAYPPASGSGYPPPAGPEYPPPGGSYPPPGGSYPPAGYPGYPPPEGYAGGQGTAPRPEERPGEAHAAHYYYGTPPPYGYGPAPPGYGPLPPGYGPPPYGMPVLGYGPPHPGYGPAPGGYPYSRGLSPRRDRDRRNNRGEKGGGKGDRRPNNRIAVDAKSRLQQWLQLHHGWTALWLEGIDPPRQLASNPNVTLLMVAKTNFKKAGGEEFGFVLTSSRIVAKKKDREKECAKDIVAALDQLPLEDMKAWCQMPETSAAKREVDPADLERLTTVVQRRCPKVTVALPEPVAFVVAASLPWGPHERLNSDPDLAVLERFDAGFSELLREARRVSGLVRKQWFLALVLAKPGESNEERQPFALGMGMATEPNLAKARAVHAAEIRAQILTEAMFTKVVKDKAPQDRPPSEAAGGNAAQTAPAGEPAPAQPQAPAAPAATTAPAVPAVPTAPDAQAPAAAVAAAPTVAAAPSA